MKSILKFASAMTVCACGLLGQQASATLISGEISFDGSYTTNNANLALATAFTSFTGVVVSAAPTGDYAGLAGMSVVQNAFSFNPLPGGGVVPLWSIPGASGASFDLLSVTTSFSNATTLVLDGTGTAFLNGRDPTFGKWELTANTLGSTFSFSSTNVSSPNVPEPGTALAGAMMLGLCGVVRRRRPVAAV